MNNEHYTLLVQMHPTHFRYTNAHYTHSNRLCFNYQLFNLVKSHRKLVYNQLLYCSSPAAVWPGAALRGALGLGVEG